MKNDEKQVLLDVKNLKKYFNVGNKKILKAVDDISLQIYKGETLGLVGESGCGKSTFGRTVIHLYDPTDGTVTFDGTKIDKNLDTKQRHELCRRMQMIFQDPYASLNPRRKILDIVAEGIDAHGLAANKKERDAKVIELLETVGLQAEHADRFPHEFSGGQRQRVALARAVVKRSDYFLLDEPLSNLDAQLRLRARKELVKIHEMYRPTMVYVTHDQIEAMTVGQRVAIMYRGNMEMLDTPSHVYNMPASIFCARFIGSPSMNIISCQYENGNLSIGDQMIRLALMWRPIADACPSGKYCVGIRPEHIVLSSRPTETSICGTVKYVEDYGKRDGV